MGLGCRADAEAMRAGVRTCIISPFPQLPAGFIWSRCTDFLASNGQSLNRGTGLEALGRYGAGSLRRLRGHENVNCALKTGR